MRKTLTAFMLLLALCMLAMPVVAQEDDDIYTDPEGLYTVPIPTNWTVTENDGYTTLASPEDEILWHVLVVEDTDEDLETVLANAWAVVDPEFAEEPQDINRPDVTDDEEVDEVLIITYSVDPQLYQAVAFVADGYVFIWLIDGSLSAIEQRSSQIAIIQSGFDILTGDNEDTVFTPEAALPIDDAMLAELEAFIERVLPLSEVPGLAVAIVQGDEVIYSNGFGENVLGEPIDSNTMFMIGSTTKTMTTMMMGTLVDDGLMAWDTPVIEILPSFAVADDELTQTITVENLVCACSGVPRRDFELVFNQNDLTAQDTIASLAGFEFFTDFGEAFQYSNQMVAAGGYIATLAAGGDYDTLYEDYIATMQERIFDAIGMTKTTFDFSIVDTNGNYAQPYGVNLGDEYYPIDINLDLGFGLSIAPAGGAWSSVSDMAQYLMVGLNEGVASNGTQIISGDTLNYLWQPQVPFTATDSYGLGWIISDYNGLLHISHDGNMLGYTSGMNLLPELDLGIIVLTNARGSNIINSAVWARLLELVFDQEATIEDGVMDVINDSAEQLASINFVDLDTETLESFLGTYTNEALGEITLYVENGTLYMDAGDWVSELRQYDNDGEIGYIMYDMPLAGVEVSFEVDENDSRVVVVGSGTIEYTFTPAG